MVDSETFASENGNFLTEQMYIQLYCFTATLRFLKKDESYQNTMFFFVFCHVLNNTGFSQEMKAGKI